MMKYVSMEMFLMGRARLEDLSDELVANANTIVPKINELLEKFGEFRNVNSGYRRPEDNVTAGGSLKSWHMKCAAIDLSDKDGKLNQFCKDNTELLEQLGLWCEERQGGWQHFQIYAPRSGNRWFNP